MAREIIMPKLGLTMDEGTIIAWLKQEGDYVSLNEPLFEIETDKTTQSWECDTSGYLLKILVPAGETAAVAAPIAILGEQNEAVSEPAPQAEKPVAPGEAPVAKKPSGEAAGAGRILITPVARKLAAQHGIDLALINGSGPNGRISEQDVQNYINAAEPAPAADEEEPYGGVRKKVGDRLQQSYQTAPHFFLSAEIDMHRVITLREQAKEQGGSVSLSDYIIAACAEMLAEFPSLNARLLNEEKIIHSGQINIGYAVDTQRGLLVPVLRDMRDKSPEEIAAIRARIVERALSGTITQDETTGGTFTISSMGSLGVRSFTAIINPPQSAILAVASVEKRLRVMEDDSFAARPLMVATLSSDHRLIDGAYAAKAMARFKQTLERWGS